MKRRLLLFTWLILRLQIVDGSREDDPYDVTSIISLLGSSNEIEARRRMIDGGRDDDSGEDFNNGNMMTECYCMVVVNGVHSLKGEQAICGENRRSRRRILCPHHVGCQMATANVQGFVSIVKTCGQEEERVGCRIQRQRAQFVGDVEVRRCHCMGRLCNGTSFSHPSIVVWTLVTLICLHIDY